MTLNTQSQWREKLNKIFDKNTFSDERGYSEPLREDLLNDIEALLLTLKADTDRESRLAGMQQAKSRVLRRTEIPKDAREPTRDIVVLIGEECARIIDEDIKALSTTTGGDGGLEGHDGD